jgi:hypothetical protein
MGTKSDEKNYSDKDNIMNGSIFFFKRQKNPVQDRV